MICEEEIPTSKLQTGTIPTAAKKTLKLAIMGHIDSGKSTLIGHFMYKVGCIPDRDMKNNEKTSMEIGKLSFKYAWVMDKLKAERERGITINWSVAKFETA